MKKLILLASVTALAINAYSQGTITFINNSGTRVQYSPGVNAANDIRVGVYFYPGTVADENLLQLPTTAGTTLIAAQGIFNGGTVSLTNPSITVAGGGNATIQIRAWSAAAGATWEDAMATGNTSYWQGKSVMWTQATGNATPTDPAKSILPPAGGYAGITLTPVPEPSTVLLGLSGLLGLFLLRRKMA